MGLFRRKRQESLSVKKEIKQLIEHAGGCIITKSLLEGTSTLKWVFREESINDVDNGWRAFGDSDDDAYVNDAKNLCVVNFNTLANLEPSVLHIYHMPYGSELEFKRDQTGVYFVNCLNGEEIREKVLSPLQRAFEENLKFLSKSEHTTEEMQMIFTQQAHVQCFTMGDVTMPSGHVVVADPLCYLQSDTHFDTLAQTISPGNYYVTLSILQSIAGIRIVGAALTITNAPVVRYKLAQCVGHELAGFGVDAGMCCFADKEAVLAYHAFLKQWYKEHPDGNIYDDYFQERFAQSYQQYPSLQREEGDFLLWNIPESTHTIAMFSSGLGDGFYSSFWGYDANDQIVQLVVPFMKVDVFLP